MSRILHGKIIYYGIVYIGWCRLAMAITQGGDALVKKPPMGVTYKRRRFYLGKSYWFKIHNHIILTQDMVLFGKLHKAPNLFLLPIY